MQTSALLNAPMDQLGFADFKPRLSISALKGFLLGPGIAQLGACAHPPACSPVHLQVPVEELRGHRSPVRPGCAGRQDRSGLRCGMHIRAPQPSPPGA